MKSRIFEYGGIAASCILIAFGIGALVMGITGRSEVSDKVKQEKIVGTPDMSPSGIEAGIKEAGLKVSAPTCSVADKPINSGSRAKCFAEYLRIHALEATGGKVYAEMGRFLTADGKDTSDEAAAAKDPKTGRPVPNALRDTWVTATALSTALNTSFFAQQVALFSIIMGVALLLTGIGFLVVTVRWLRAPERGPERASSSMPVTA